ncbi:hypothetical protein [Intrasporangium mesophilum]
MVVLATAGAGIVLATNERRDHQVHLTTLATAPFGASEPSTKAGQTWTFGAIPLCLDRPGSAHIDSIEAINPHDGLHVTDFAARPFRPEGFGAEPRPLSTIGFGGSATVTSDCAGRPGGAELAVELVKDHPGDARADGLLLRWHSSDADGVISIPFHIVLCHNSDLDAPACDP